jgi:hypothetical protein
VIRRLAAALTLALLHVTTARAAHAPVALTVDRCVLEDEREVRRVALVELQATLVDPALADPDATRASASCRDALIELRVDDPLTGKVLLRDIDLAQVAAPARARLLGLAIAELVSASWTELAVAPLSGVAPAGRTASTQAREAGRVAIAAHLPDRAAPRTLRLIAFAGGQALFAGSGVLWGGGLKLTKDYAHHLGFSLDVAATHGDAAGSLGRISSDLITAGAFFIGHRGFSGRAARLTLRGGPGLRVGAARLSGAPADPTVAVGHALWGPFFGPAATIALGFAAARRITIEVWAEAGYAALSTNATASGARAVALGGPWVGFQLGIGVFP